MGEPLTPSQTVGPFHHIELPYGDGHIVPPATPGARPHHGTGDRRRRCARGRRAGRGVAGRPVRALPPSADDRDLPLLEGFTGFGRVATAADGSYELWTVTPGPVPGPDGSTQAPHLLVSVFARGLLDRLVTRMYFPEQAAANAADPVFALVTDPDRRATLVAQDDGGALRFDIRLQGERETVFLAI